MSFQQGLVVIVISIKCLYIYFLRNSTNFRHPCSFDKFQSYPPNPLHFLYSEGMNIFPKGDNSTVDADLYNGGIFLGCEFGSIAMCERK